jgi:transaldolase
MTEETMRERDQLVRDFVLEGFHPRFGELDDSFPSHPVWRKLRDLGSDLWLDTGNIDDVKALWTQEFTALTTNNTLLNREVQSGRYDRLIGRAGDLLAPYELNERDLILEIAFILNAYHGLRLVETFDSYVSVEEHTDLAHDKERAIEYAHRYYHICPERFIVKIPFTPEGLLATRCTTEAGVPVNHTLGFSARQNHLITRIGHPTFVNVFLGRLNSFVADNELGSGSYVGENAVLASQREVARLRDERGSTTRQIGASFRSGEQVRDLEGLDVLTIPPKVAKAFLDLNLTPLQVSNKTGEAYTSGINQDVDQHAYRLNTLWDVSEPFVSCVDELANQELDNWSGSDVVSFFEEHGFGDVFPRFTEDELRRSREEGKIPRLESWKGSFTDGRVAVDSLMNLAGLNSFIADQEAMDGRIRDVLGRQS